MFGLQKYVCSLEGRGVVATSYLAHIKGNVIYPRITPERGVAALKVSA
jgi:hypothetical protein